MYNVASQAGLCYNEPINIVTGAMLITSACMRRKHWRFSSMDSLYSHTSESNPTKVCSTCHNMLPATTEYFSMNGKRLSSRCKVCAKAYSKEFYRKIKAKKDVLREEERKANALPDGYKKCVVCKEVFPATPEFFRRNKQSKDGLRPRCKQCLPMLPVKGDNPDQSKQCPKCQNTYPLTRKYWHVHRGTKSGFNTYCKQCKSIAKPKDMPPPPDGYKYCSKCKSLLPATPEHFNRVGEHKGRKPRLNSHCKTCTRATGRTYTAAHREDKKQYREENRETLRASKAKWDRENREHRENYDVNYRREHYEQISQRQKVYHGRYYKTERGRIQMRTSSGNRRARKRNAEGKHTTDELLEQLQRQKSKCYYCHKKLGKARNSWVEEHIVPLSRGGSNSIDNIVIACTDCNLSKGSKPPHEWVDGGRLL